MDHTSSSGVRETSVTIPRVPMGEPAMVTSSTESSGFRRTPPFRSQVIISCSTSFTRVSVRCPDLRSSRLIPLRLILNRPALAEIGSLRVGVVEGCYCFVIGMQVGVLGRWSEPLEGVYINPSSMRLLCGGYQQSELHGDIRKYTGVPMRGTYHSLFVAPIVFLPSHPDDFSSGPRTRSVMPRWKTVLQLSVGEHSGL